MEKENVHNMDLFLGLTSDDEDNIMGCLLAKRLGAGRVLSLINRKAYAELVEGTQIDIALTPSHAVIGELLTYVRRGDVEMVHSLRRGAAEALELVVRGDQKTGKVAGRRVDQIKWPEGAYVGAVLRPANHEEIVKNGEVIMPHHDLQLQARDHVIVFVTEKRLVKKVEKLFQVSATFLF